MKTLPMIGFAAATLLALGGCGDKKDDGVTSAKPDTSTSAAPKGSTAGKGNDAKPSTSAPTPTSAPPPRSGASASGPVGGLADVGARLDEGFKKFIDGQDLAAAFPGWSATAKDEAKLRADLKEVGATSGKTADLEFELVMQKEGKDVYYLRTAVVPGEGMFASFDGRPETHVTVTSHELSEFAGEAALKTSAESLFATVKGPDCEKVPLITAAVGDKLGGGPLAAELTKAIEKLKTSVPKTCKEIATAGADSARLRIDDVGLVALGADGKLVGLVSASFELKDGKLVLTFKRLKKV